ncbi:hypothetical protein ACFVS2_21880 [Brevibacillus sp. NPDC058079]|uniref:hypothetical protein n=1 Tax=Brevibacillus sp. NPDC058079 TaxID=3346330 RepID=UPI0036E18FDA
MKKKILLGLLTGGIICGISLSLYMSFSDKTSVVDNPEPSKEQPSKPTQTGNNSETPDVTEKPKPPNKEDIYEKPPEKQLRSIGSSEAVGYENEARKAFRNFEFLKGVEDLKSIVDQVENKEPGEKLHQFYFEGSMIANLVPPTEEQEMTGDHGEMIEFDGMVGILNSIKDPENALLGTLVLNDRYRAEIILEQGSLNPIFSGGVRILNKSTEATGDIYVDVINMYPNVKTLHKLDFEIEGHHLVSYVIEFADGYSRVYTVLPVEGVKTPYKTILQWKKIYSLIEKK